MDTHAFRRTRIILTSWYVAILAIILFAFSFVLYTGEQHDFIRIIVQRDFNSRIPRQLTPSEREDVENQLVAIRRAFLVNLLTIDGLILVIGGGLSYFLAGKTLSPIQETFMKQKEFLADVSHEIRTPLAAIQTATEVSLRTNNKSKEEYKKVLGQVHDQTKRLTKMANDLLLLSRLETHSTEKFTKVSLSRIVGQAADAFSSVAKEKQITITIPGDDQVFVLGDKDSLMQLVMIFLDNAIKYTNPNGHITLALSQDPKPQLTITDTGIGMSQKDTLRIFERFYQADSSRSQKGNGLGLAIAKEILLSHKAKVQVVSSVGKGTTFALVFPHVS